MVVYLLFVALSLQMLYIVTYSPFILNNSQSCWILHSAPFSMHPKQLKYESEFFQLHWTPNEKGPNHILINPSLRYTWKEKGSKSPHRFIFYNTELLPAIFHSPQALHKIISQQVYLEECKGGSTRQHISWIWFTFYSPISYY